MVEDRSMVEQAGEIQTLAKDLKNFSKETQQVCGRRYFSKLPPSWGILLLFFESRDFATSQKHKRHEFTIDGLIGTLDVEEKAREKDTRGKGNCWSF